MQRRGFIATLGLPLFHPGNKPLRFYRAVAAQQLPAFLKCGSDAMVVEVRRYSGQAASAKTLAGLLVSHGAHVIVRDGLAFQLGFASLEARQVAWASLTADIRWALLQDCAALVPQEISVYVRGSVSI